MSDSVELRQQGDPTLPALIYLPGLHGDWTLVGSFRRASKAGSALSSWRIRAP